MAQKTFDLKAVKRNKCLKWDAAANKGKGGALVTSDFLNDDGTVNSGLAASVGVKDTDVVYLTPADLPEPYRQGYKQALEFHAKENEMSAQDTVYRLIIADAMQDLANASVAAFRPITDKARERAESTLRKVLQAQGKSEEEITSVLAMLVSK